VIVLGLILLVIGWLLGINLLVTAGIVVLLVGAALWIAGSVGRPVGRRKHYY